MKDREYHLHDGKSGSAITVRVTPRASRNEVSEILDDGTIKVRLVSSLSEDKSNQELIVFLAEVLEVSPSQLEIVAGAHGHDKLITITDLDKNMVQERILKHVA